MSEPLRVEREGPGEGVVLVTLDRPARLNALDDDLRRRLATLWADLAADRSVRCVVLTGAGRAFSSGLDADDAHTGPPVRHAFSPGSVLEVPVVVALNGLCVGGALRFVAEADVVVAAADAWLADPHVSLGLTSGDLAVRLAARSTPAAVAPLLLGGAEQRLDAEAARAAGLVSEVLPAPEVLPRARALAAAVAAQSPTAVRETLALLRRAGGPSDDLVAAGWQALARTLAHPDAAEARAARAAGRAPRWAPAALPADPHPEEHRG